jgi:hypothetical protein
MHYLMAVRIVGAAIESVGNAIAIPVTVPITGMSVMMTPAAMMPIVSILPLHVIGLGLNVDWRRLHIHRTRLHEYRGWGRQVDTWNADPDIDIGTSHRWRCRQHQGGSCQNSGYDSEALVHIRSPWIMTSLHTRERNVNRMKW